MAVFLHIRNNNIRRRHLLRKQRVFHARINPLDVYDDDEIRRRYRLTRPLILELYDLIGAGLEPRTNRNHAIPGMLKIFCALRYYACGSFQTVVGDGLGIHRSSVSRIVTKVTNAICRLRNRYISFPRTQEQLTAVKQAFHRVAQFPNVIGAIDGTLISILTPHEDEHLYVSRKGGHSLNILAICDTNMKFLYVVVKYPGSTNDAYIWSNCHLEQILENGDLGDGWLLGDSGFGLDRHLLTPISDPQTQAERDYNSAHCRTRQVIERAFGLTKQRFRCIHRSGGDLTYDPAKCCKIIVTCMILHNICVNANVPLDGDEDEENSDNDDRQDGGGIGDIRANVHARDRRHNAGLHVRRRLVEQVFA